MSRGEFVVSPQVAKVLSDIQQREEDFIEDEIKDRFFNTQR